MEIDIVDLLFHIADDLPASERGDIEHELQDCDGVLSAHFVSDRPHMLMVAYNPDAVNPGTLRQRISNHGITASLVAI